MSHLTNEQHISQENLLRYVEDDCSRTEMREIDRHLATCPMCSDAVEGLMLLSEPSIAIAHLNKRIDEKVLEKINAKPANIPLETSLEQPILTVIKRPFWQQRWAAAAAVLLLVSGSIWLFKNTQSSEKQAVASTQSETITDTVNSSPPQYAAAETAKKDEISAKLSTPNGIVNNSELTQLKENKRDVLKDNLNKKTDTISNYKTAQNETESNTDIALADQNRAAEKAAPKPTSAPATYAPQGDRTRDYAGASAQNSVPFATTAAAMKSKDAEVAKAEDAENEAKKTNKSLEEVVVVGSSKAKKSMPAAKAPPSVSTTSDDILSSADGYFKQKYYETAATEYARFLNTETSGDRHERALFQLATCYVKLNKKAEAKIIFEKLSAMNGQYERAAKKALKDL